MGLERWVGKAAVVTGAATGFGRSITQKMIEKGIKVAGFDINEADLKKNKDIFKKNKELYFPVKANLLNEDETLKAFDWTKKNLGPIHILVNNAGVLCKEPLVTGKSKGWRDTFGVNVLGLCVCTKEAMQDMIKNKVDGQVIHICSITGHYVPYVPGWSVYPSTKFAVTALTETMRQELNYMDSQIKISQICPGFAVTDLANDWKSDNVIHKNIKGSRMKADDIANAVIYILSTPPHVQIHDLVIRPVGEKA